MKFVRGMQRTIRRSASGAGDLLEEKSEPGLFPQFRSIRPKRTGKVIAQ